MSSTMLDRIQPAVELVSIDLPGLVYICAGVFPAQFYAGSFGALSAFEEELAKKSSLSSTAMS